jgi:hypothetical protein
MRLPKPSRILALVLALLGVVMLSRAPRAWAVAPAATSSTLSEADEDRLLQTSIARAKEQLARGDAAAALSILTQAYGQVPTPALLWPIAELHLRLGQPKEGRAALDKYVAQVPPSRMPKGQQLPDVEKLREELGRQLGRLVLLPLEPGTSVRVDDDELDAAAQEKPVEVNPGRHRLTSKLGSRALVREVVLNAGQELRIDLRPAGSAALELDPVSGRPHRRTVRSAAIVLGGIAIAGVIAGGVLWGLDGLQSCPQAPMCSTALDSQATGIGLLSAGLGLGGAALLLGLIDDRSSRTDEARR